MTSPNANNLARRKLLTTAASAAAIIAAPAVLARETAATGISPFRISVPESQIADLKRRLRATRWPDRGTVGDARQGARLDDMRTLVKYWESRYNWRKVESRLNSYPQYKTHIDGLGIHFHHIRSPHKEALPLVMTHGWPGSTVEFLDTIGPLVNPTAHGGSASDAFHLVLPSLPGYGFSDKPTAPGWGRNRTARAWGELMSRLGYRDYVAQGGDWGNVITTEMARLQLPGLRAIHLNLINVAPNPLPENPTEEEKIAIQQLNKFFSDGGGYGFIQGTRPQTLGYALADSPAGQAAWIYEKLAAWTDSDGRPESVLTFDQMLDDISIYWFTNSAASSARMYAENPGLTFARIPLDIPVAVTIFPGEIYTPPRSWAEAAYSKLIYWNKVAKGGHFAAFEQPKIFVDEVRAGFRSIRKT